MSLTKTELKLMAQLLEMAREIWANQCCNDFEIKNTPEHKKLLIDIQHWNYSDPNDKNMKEKIAEIKKTKTKTIYTQDYSLADYLAYRCRKEAK